MVNINIKLSNKTLYILIGILAVLAVTGVAIAIGSGPYTTHGHNADELDLSGIIGGGGFSFGDWESKNTNQNYGPVATDGFVIASGFNYAKRPYTRGFSDANNPPTTLIAEGRGGDYEYISISFPVKKGHYWNVSQATTVWWIPVTGSSIPCSWTGWQPSMTFTVNDGSKYGSSYLTMIFECQDGVVTQMIYTSCLDARDNYGISIDCTD